MRLRNPVFAAILVLFSALAPAADISTDYNIGVYYFPGWKIKAPGGLVDYPWIPIKPYPDREPLLGWYIEGDVGVMNQQLGWMNAHGVDFVMFDWYWNTANQPYLDHALNTYLQAENRSKVKFGLLWANEAQKNVPDSEAQFLTMVQYWIDNYFGKAEFLKIGNKPVVVIFSVEKFRARAATFGKTVKQLFEAADLRAKQAGYPGIYFVAATEAVEYWVKWFNPENGFSALSAYNYHRGFSGVYIPLKPYSHSYEELDNAYRESWDWILKAATLPYWVPATTGWDKRPWGGSTDPLHDLSFSNPAQFKAHLQAAKQRIDQYPTKSMKTLLICCWNEYGEGSVLEPSKKYQYQYLEAVRSVFGSSRPSPPSELQGIIPSS